MARKRDRWEAVCASSAPSGTNKRLDEVQLRHVTPLDC